ncbi:Uncharacterised protein [Mycobacteroides abscessus subsp. abscessus]|nr:Uncharacterised protein [Mycobacteroides abscessus subsp. abscessus]
MVSSDRFIARILANATSPRSRSGMRCMKFCIGIARNVVTRT